MKAAIWNMLFGNTDSQSDLTKLPQICQTMVDEGVDKARFEEAVSAACRDLGGGPRTGYLTPPVQRLEEQVSDPGKAARIAVYAIQAVQW